MFVYTLSRSKHFVVFRLSKLKPTPLRSMACRYCSPIAIEICVELVFIHEMTLLIIPIPSDRPIMAVPIFRSPIFPPKSQHYLLHCPMPYITCVWGAKKYRPQIHTNWSMWSIHGPLACRCDAYLSGPYGPHLQVKWYMDGPHRTYSH